MEWVDFRDSMVMAMDGMEMRIRWDLNEMEKKSRKKALH